MRQAVRITGKGIANPLASILSVALMLDISFGLKRESEAVIKSVEEILKAGFRTVDIADAKTSKNKILNTEQTGNKVIEQLEIKKVVDMTALQTSSFIASIS